MGQRRLRAIDQRFRQRVAPYKREHNLKGIDNRSACRRRALLRENVQRLRKSDDKISVNEKARDHNAGPRNRREGRRLNGDPYPERYRSDDDADPRGDRHRVVLFRVFVQLYDEESAHSAADEHAQQPGNLCVVKRGAQRTDDPAQNEDDGHPGLFVHFFLHGQKNDRKHHDRDGKGERSGRNVEVIQTVQKKDVVSGLQNAKQQTAQQKLFSVFRRFLSNPFEKTGEKDQSRDPGCDDRRRERQNAVRDTGKNDHFCRPAQRNANQAQVRLKSVHGNTSVMNNLRSDPGAGAAVPDKKQYEKRFS